MGRGGSGAYKLYVESPLNIMDDVATGAFNYSAVKTHFRIAYDILHTMGPKSHSLLSHIVSDKLF